MTANATRLLLIEDNPDDARLLREMLRDGAGRYDIVHELSLDGGLRRLGGQGFDVVLLDLSLPDGQGVETVVRAHSLSRQTPIVVLTGLDDTDTGTRALQAGAQDYLVKGQFETSLLERSIRYAIERVRTMEALRASEERYALAVRGTSDGIWDWNLVDDRIYFSPRWAAMIGMRDSEIEERPEVWLNRVHPDDGGPLRLALRAHATGITPHFEAEYRILHTDGNYRWMLSRGSTVRGSDGVAVRMVGAQTDVTERKVQDPLTGLPNRTLFLDRLDRAINRAQRKARYDFAVLVVDLDRFKLVNDGLGHAAGDRLLMELANRIENCLRIGDTVARLSGDQFTILLEDIKLPHGATLAARRIQESIAAPIALGSQEIFMTATVGIALSASGYASAQEVLRDAGTALHQAKSIGKGEQRVFDAAMHAQALEALQIEMDLRRALERAELTVFYQPIVSVKDGTLVGFEALVRWRHPTRGLIAAGNFVPLLEESGLMVPVGKWILGESCRRAQQWQGRGSGRAPYVSVNLSSRQFGHADLVVDVREALTQSSLPTENLRLEITEEMFSENAATVCSVLAELRAQHIRLAMDDFGTGYSSLSRLHQIAFDSLKIDRSLISRLDGDAKSPIVRAIVNLAHDLNLEVVAEGVETTAQLVALAEMGCEYAQGHLFAKAVAHDQAQLLVDGGKLTVVGG